MHYDSDTGTSGKQRALFEQVLPPVGDICGGADLHVHTTASDGVLPPAKVVLRAAQVGLEAVAITDHDTLDGLQEALLAGTQQGIEVVGGVELSTELDESEVHVLGYFVDQQDRSLNDLLARLRNARLDRTVTMVQRLVELGMDISLDAVLREAGDGAVGRPHVARALVTADYVDSTTEAFKRFLSRGKPAYVPRFKLTPEQALSALREAGAVTSLAHPFLIADRSIIPGLLELGFDAIEVRHSEQSRCREYELWLLARRHRLAMTGGSDWHGDDRECRARLGGSRVPTAFLGRLRELGSTP